MCICVLSGPACMLVYIHLFICTLIFSANAWNWALSAGTSLVSMRAPFSSLHHHPRVDRCVLTLLDRRNNVFSTPPNGIVEVLTVLGDLDTAVRFQSPYYQTLNSYEASISEMASVGFQYVSLYYK